MNKEKWEKKYSESTEKIQKAVTRIKGIIVAYNTNIDAIVNVKSGFFGRFFRADSSLERAVLAKLDKPAGEIDTVEDFFAGLLNCIRLGTAEEWIIKNRDVFLWMESELRCDHLGIGGQAGIIANTLARLGVRNVTVHAASLPAEQARLFLDNVKVPTTKNGKVVLETPQNAMRSSDEKMVHYVFQYQAGTRFHIQNQIFESPCSNRFVATWDPKNTKLEVDNSFLNMATKSIADRAIISGYHLLRSKFENSSTHIEKIIQTVEQIEKWKKENSNFFIHLESGDSKYLEVYASTMKLLAPHIDSIGLNENEIAKISSALGLPNPKPEQLSDAVTMFKMAKRLIEIVDVQVILVHTLDFTLCIIRTRKKQSAKSIRDVQNGILFGSSLAAARAASSDFNDVTRVKQEIAKRKFFLSLNGMAEHKRLARFLEKTYSVSQKDFSETGIAKILDFHVIYIVSKLTRKPATTAGLGDSLVSGFILAVN